MRNEEENIILRGVGASPGIARGRVKIVTSLDEMDKMNEGDILVAPVTSPDYTPCILRASAIVTDIGGILSHAAIISREMGIPCVVGTNEGTKKLKDYTEVTVDGDRGIVY